MTLAVLCNYLLWHLLVKIRDDTIAWKIRSYVQHKVDGVIFKMCA